MNKHRGSVSRSRIVVAELWEKYKDDPDQILIRSLYPPTRNCLRQLCGKEFECEGIYHIYCCRECQDLSATEKTTIPGNELAYRYEPGESYHPYPAILEEGSITCCRCSSKLPRDMPELWTLVPMEKLPMKEGWACTNCSR